MTEQPQPTAQPERKSLCTVKQVAAFLNMSEAYIYELAKRRLIPCGKIGRCYRFEMVEIEAWWTLRKRGGRRG